MKQPQQVLDSKTCGFIK